MISIDKVTPTPNLFYPIYSCNFPTIDFKFQNVGTATAFLKRFTIKVLQAEIDLTPVLDFELKVVNNALQVIATNNGWGGAHDCNIQISGNILSRLFTDFQRQYKGNIPSGESKEILSLTKKSANTIRFKAIKKEFVDIYNQPSGPPFHQSIRGIELGKTNVTWSCRDDNGTEYQNQVNIQGFDNEGNYILIENGFFKTSNIRSGGGAYSDIMYVSIIDPSKGIQEKTYSISRQIPSGDVERFHIMIGSPMSCRLSTQFQFFSDQTDIVESEKFGIELWNPRNTQWHYPYRDDDRLRRDIEQRQADIAKYSNERDKELALPEIVKLKQQMSIYPFTKID